MIDTTKEIKILKEKVQEKKALIGTDVVLKGLRQERVSKVFLSNNCPATTKQEILHFARLSKVTLIELEQNNEELGVLCKKRFFVSVAGI